MIRLALVLSQAGPCEAVPLIAEDTGVLKVIASYRDAAPETIAPSLMLLNPEVLLLDLDFGNPLEAIRTLRKSTRNTLFLGFSCDPGSHDFTLLQSEGLSQILATPFSALELEKAVHTGLRSRVPVDDPAVLLFLPSKAGCGCSTVALTTAASLANELGLRTLLIEADRRSGPLSILLDREGRGGLPAVLADSDKLSPLGWNQHIDSIGKLDLLLANPLSPGPQPTWADFFHILQFLKGKYDFVVADLPELVNPATAELAAAARSIFIVCEPELASVKMTGVRRAELEAVGVPAEKICVLANRWDPKRLTRAILEHTAGLPMYAALPNDYQEVKNASMESRLVAAQSAFAIACATLARRVSGRPQLEPEGAIASILRRVPGLRGNTKAV